MQPEQATFLMQSVILPGIKSEHSATKALLGAIPAEQCDYRPDGIAKTAMELAWHIVATEMRFMDSALAGQFDIAPRPRPEAVQTPAELVAFYEQAVQERLTRLEAATGEQMAAIIDFRGMMQLPAAMLLNLMLKHSVHHRGQLSMYLRPMGAKVPSIYGESHDAAEARKAKQTGA
jgi:uncharacterized damage-inducible protein DinB